MVHQVRSHHDNIGRRVLTEMIAAVLDCMRASKDAMRRLTELLSICILPVLSLLEYTAGLEPMSCKLLLSLAAHPLCGVDGLLDRMPSTKALRIRRSSSVFD